MRYALPCRLTLIAAAVLATGCASLSTDGPADARPTLSVAPARATSSSAATLYAIGRQRLADGHANGALEAFDAALRLDPEHVDARNGRATTLAQLGRADLAVEELRRAIARAPAAAHLQNNLGYLLMTQGRLEEAELALRGAAAADPTNARIQANLAALATRRPQVPTDAPARARLDASTQGVVNITYGPVAVGARDGGAAPVAPAARGAGALQGPGAAAPVVGSISSMTVPSVPAAAIAAQPELPRPAAVQAASPAVAVQAASAVAPAPALPVAVQAVAVARPPASAAPASAAALPPIPTFRLEVSNGAGTAGLARRTAGTLRNAGAQVARVTNHADFTQRATSLHYRDGQRAAAVALQARLGLPDSALVRNDALPAGVDAKLVLGHDLAAGIGLDRPMRAAYVEPLRLQALALQAVLDAAVI